MCFRGGFTRGVEIPADWARDVLLLPDRLFKTRSTRSREVTILLGLPQMWVISREIIRTK